MELLRIYFMEELSEFHRREKRWLIILPEVERHLHRSAVAAAVEQHLEQTVAHVNFLEELFRLIRAADLPGSQRMRPLLQKADEVLAAVARSSLPSRVRPVRTVYPSGGRN